ncbi:hypothetical protein PLICRDRAFT_106575 [Plicaturopsis crispa FD-325 SS-3]|nr:hypothetical protein PLICRDRAFT_106575 [Plicaturopsis crispa FD-325 SS-3]
MWPVSPADVRNPSLLQYHGTRTESLADGGDASASGQGSVAPVLGEGRKWAEGVTPTAQAPPSPGPDHPRPQKRLRLDIAQTISTIAVSHTARTPSSRIPIRRRRAFRTVAQHVCCPPADCAPPISPIINLQDPRIVPSHIPPTNRLVLRDLDLQQILRNPHIRHGLLFEARLKFKRLASPREQDVNNKYWSAVIREVETGCTCATFTMTGKPCRPVCACHHIPLSSSRPTMAYSLPLGVVTLRLPSRIPNLLAELREVLCGILPPLVLRDALSLKPQRGNVAHHAFQAAHLRAVLDPEFIQQQFRHGVFDASSLFHYIGTAMKLYCAPCRDSSVDAMVAVAQSCGPDGRKSNAQVIRAVEMCMDLAEVMKIDIANHQLKSMRPFLMRTSGPFERKAFLRRKDGRSSLVVTRKWLSHAHHNFSTKCAPVSNNIQIPSSSHRLESTTRSQSIIANYPTSPRNQQIYLSVLSGLVDLVFVPPSPFTPAKDSIAWNRVDDLPGFPETVYLDSDRLFYLAGEASALISLYMFLMLYRQLLIASSSVSCQKIHKDAAFELLKHDICAIGGPHLARCFLNDRLDSQGGEPSWRHVRQDIVVQVTARAQEVRNGTATSYSDRIPLHAPDEDMLRLAQRWADANMQPASPLGSLLRRRLRDVLFHAVVATAYPLPQFAVADNLSLVDPTRLHLPASTCTTIIGTGSGMEPLVHEICLLAEGISRLAVVHLNTYLPLYYTDNILDA